MPLVDLFEFTQLGYTIGESTKFDEESRTLILRENQLVKLEKLNEKYGFLEIGRKTIKPKNLVGVVKVGDLTLQIFPKLLKTSSYEELESNKTLLMGNLLRMLSIGGELPVKSAEIAGLVSEKASFLEVLISIYSTKLLETLRYHRHYTYRGVEEDLNHVKGQINFTRYVSRWHKKHVIPVRYNNRTVDNLLNRTLKYGAHLMAHLTRSNENYRRLKNAMGILEGVSTTPVSIHETYRIHFTRLNVVFKPLIELARIFIAGTTLRPQSGNIETFTFLIPMERVFESFIAGLLTNRDYGALLEDLEESTVKSQHNIGTLLTEGKFRLIPDITIETRDGKRIIIDTKYKLLNEEDKKLGVSQSDLYQMYAYASHWNADAVVLLYPTLSGEANKEWHFRVPIGDRMKTVPLLIRSVNLGYNFLDNREWRMFVENFRDVLRDSLLNIKRSPLT